MKYLSKILIIGIVLLTIMIATPSMIGIAQSFLDNNHISEDSQEINEENLEDEFIGSNEKIEEDEKLEIDENIDENENEEVVDCETEAERDSKENVKPDPNKKVFLTFDDGPSTVTPEILNILNENEVKATFFTIGKSVEKKPEIVKQTYDEGHMVLPHTYSHEYSIYTSFETYYNDLELAKKSIEEVLDIEVPYIFRFPGGSSNHSSFEYGGEQFMPKLTKDVKEKGYYYIDWNVTSGDASADYTNKNKLINNVINGAKNKDFIVVLFHDTARNTSMAEVLPEIILELKGEGYTFRTFRDITEEELDKMVELKLSNKPIIR